MTSNVTFRTGPKSLASVPNPGKTVTKASRLRGSRGVIVGS